MLQKLTVKDVIAAASRKKNTFGIKEYHIVDKKYLILDPRATGFSKLNDGCFADKEAKLKAFMPPPNKYAEHIDWSKVFKGHKGEFLKQKRRTIATDIIEAARVGTPGPGAYFTKQKAPKKEEKKPYEEKTCSFIDDATA